MKQLLLINAQTCLTIIINQSDIISMIEDNKGTEIITKDTVYHVIETINQINEQF